MSRSCRSRGSAPPPRMPPHCSPAARTPETRFSSCKTSRRIIRWMADFLMELRRFDSIPRPVPVIGQGTWYDDTDNRDAAIAALRRGLDLGMTHIDTAEMYL